MTRPPVRAAGGVVVRDSPDGPEVLLVFRRRYGDWTLPKGKCEQGETHEDCALREVQEETGLRCALLAELPATTYTDRRGRGKVVRYWAMRVVEGEARPAPPEVDEVRWVAAGSAAALLTHAHDADVVRVGAGRLASARASGFSLTPNVGRGRPTSG